MEPIDYNIQNENDKNTFSEIAKQHLFATAPWIKIFSIISSILIIINIIIYAVILNKLEEIYTDEEFPILEFQISIISIIVLSLFLIYVLIQLFLYGQYISEFKKSNSQTALINAFKKQKIFYLICGILCIILFSTFIILLMTFSSFSISYLQNGMMN